MDQLLIIPSGENTPQTVLKSLRQAGWRTTVTLDIQAKQALQRGGVFGLVMELQKGAPDKERLKILRFVREFCPDIMVILLYTGMESLESLAEAGFSQTLDAMDMTDVQPENSAALDLYRLSPAQKRIALLVAQAYPNREIARQLKIKEQSVRNELSRIFKKMGVWNRVELALLMREGKRSSGTVSAPQPAQKQEWSTNLNLPVEGHPDKTMTI